MPYDAFWSFVHYSNLPGCKGAHMATRAQLDTTKLIEQAHAKLRRQQALLADTQAQLELVTLLEQANPGAYLPAFKQITTKRDRQRAAVTMTQSFIDALKKAPKQA